MTTIKTLPNDANVEAFIQAVEHAGRREDGLKLLEIYRRLTGLEPVMWGDSLIGFGQYHYKSERSRQEGDWPLTAFSPRKANLTLYFMDGFEAHADLLARLGKHKTSMGCLYLNKLADVDLAVLTELITANFNKMKATHA